MEEKSSSAKAQFKRGGPVRSKRACNHLQVASGDLKAADQPQAPPYAKSMGAVETAQIQLFLIIPNYKNRTASPHPIIVTTPNQGCFCIDGWEMVEEARKQNLPSIVCEIIHVSSDSETEIALHKVAVRSMPLGGTCDYPETIRNTVLIFKMLMESSENLEVFSHGGARRGTGFTKVREEDVITILAERLGKSRKTILKNLEEKVSLTISITKAIRDRLRTMAVEQNLQDPDRLTSASTIAREIIADYLDGADEGQEKTTKGGQPQ